MAVTFTEARALVLREVRVSMPVERISIHSACGRVLAEEILADRDYPPFPRSARDGFAVHASDFADRAATELRAIGEVRAGEAFAGPVGDGETVEIMTGAPVPEGADAVVMVEHISRHGDRIALDLSKNSRAPKPGDNITPRGSEAPAGRLLLESGHKLGYAEVALLAMVGYSSTDVFRQPRVAIIPTGDELVEIEDQPQPHQIRNSNAASLAVQVTRAGGIPEILPIARDSYDATYALIERGLESDLLLLSGGVSAGKYDIVERVLADFEADFFFDRVLIQPGQPLVFGRAKGGGKKDTFFFGLPGNPGSTMVTFETIARVAIDKMQGMRDPIFPLLRARLTRDFRQKTGLTRFLPARLSADGSEITPEPTQGSGDVPSLARANAFLVTDPDREFWAAGEDIRVLPK